MTLEDFLALLGGGKRAGTGWIARCPAHEDRQASLGVTESDGVLLVKCHAGCDTREVLNQMGLSFNDLGKGAGIDFANPEAVYPYVDEEGKLLFEVGRFPQSDGSKKFLQRQPGADGWRGGVGGVRRVLHRLPETIRAVKLEQKVYICEGEKDVEALYTAGVYATCNPGGACKWKDEYSEVLRGADVVIVADRDEPGRKHAEQVSESLQGIAKSIHIVQAAKGKDAYDHLVVHGLTVDEFVPLRQRVRRGIFTAHELADAAMEALEHTEQDVPGFNLTDSIPLTFRLGRMYAIGGYTGDGKSTFAIQGARKLASEGHRGGYVSLEMSKQDITNKLISHRGVPLSMLEEPWRIKQDGTMFSRYYDAVEEIRGWNLDIVFESGINAQKISEYALDREWDFVFVDHIHRLGWGHDRRKLEEQVNDLTNIALEQNVMLVMLCQLRRFTRGAGMESYPRPTLQDFRETEMIGQDASMALAIWRARDNTGHQYTGATEAILLKNRHVTGERDKAGKSWWPRYDDSCGMFAQAEVMEAVAA